MQKKENDHARAQLLWGEDERRDDTIGRRGKSVPEEVYGVGGAASQLSLHNEGAVFSGGREQREVFQL